MTMPEFCGCFIILLAVVATVRLLWPQPKAKPPREVALTVAAYERWMRAQRPPLEWFLALPEVEQKALQDIGNAYLQDICLGVGYALADVKAAEAGAGDSEDHEMELLDRLAGAAAKIAGARGQQDKPMDDKRHPETMGGLAGNRKHEYITPRGRVRTLMGKLPKGAAKAPEDPAP